MGRFLTLALIILLTNAAITQDPSLPRGLSPEEQQLIAEGVFKSVRDVPGAVTYRSPENAPRSIAEWEEMQAIVITWTQYRSILTEIVRNAVKEVKVIIVTSNENSARNYLENRGVDPDHNIEFVDSDFNSVWVRDYGGNPAYVNDVDSLVLVDWIYNRPRPADDLVPVAIADHLNVPLLTTTKAPFDLVNTGGNYMTDGDGRAFSSNLVMDENGPGNIWGETVHSEEDIDAIMQQFLGIDEYVKMTVLPFDAIHHIDMHMKLLDEQTILLGEYPEGVADGPQIEANLQYILENFKTASGHDYRIIRVPMPPDQFGRYPDQGGFYRTYANAMFVNKTILVPVYEEEFDTTALRIWEESMPGYQIVGIDCNDIIPASGAIHCITKEVGVHEPLWILHQQPFEVESGESVVISARIKHLSGISQAQVYYRYAGDSLYSAMLMQDESDDQWVSTLPVFDDGSTVQYYIQAAANDGKTITRPLPAPEGYFELTTGESTTGVRNALHEEIGLSVFPNPANAMTCIPLELKSATQGGLYLMDMHGRTLQVIHEGPFAAGISRYFIDAGALPSGIYTLQLRSVTGNQSVRLLIH